MVAPMRIETNHTGRQCDVIFTNSLLQDLQRRDFTCNAMTPDFDPFNGKKDLDNKILRFVGNPVDHIKEDYLRVIRFARFDLTMCPLGCAAVPKDAISKISGERIWLEFAKSTEFFSEFIKNLHHLGLLLQIFPSVAQNPKYHPEGDTFTHTIIAVSKLPKDATLEACVATLLHDIGKAETTNADFSAPLHAKVGAEIAYRELRQFNMSNKQRAHITNLIKEHMVCGKKAIRKRRIKYGDTWLSDLQVVAFCDGKETWPITEPIIKPVLNGKQIFKFIRRS